MSIEVIEEIKKKIGKDRVVLAHNYQEPTIQELANILGDSLELARAATQIEANTIIFAGVEFMAETAAILNPKKTVLIPSTNAKCPLAQMLNPSMIEEWRKAYPKAPVCVYINTTAETKASADICMTSGNAVKIASQLDSETILVGPDRNLAWHIQQKVPDKEIIAFPDVGHCYVHRRFTRDDVNTLQRKFPNAETIVHPECDPTVQKEAHSVESTSGMERRAKASEAKEFIIGTEIGMIDRLRRNLPTKKFIPLRADAICYRMKSITPYHVLRSINQNVYKIKVPEKISLKAKESIDKMLQYSS